MRWKGEKVKENPVTWADLLANRIHQRNEPFHFLFDSLLFIFFFNLRISYFSYARSFSILETEYKKKK